MDRLWTPWRYDYVSRSRPGTRAGVPAALSAWSDSAEPDRDCVFCNMLAAADYAVAQGMPVEEAELAAHILLRGPACFLCLNAYPYSTGHTLIVPYRHVDSLAALETATAEEMIGHGQRIEAALRDVYLGRTD